MLKISVIIPCYNQGNFLLSAVESVKRQSNNNSFTVEIIIVNDGSDDTNTIRFLKDINNDDVIVIHQENKGLAAARNVGLSSSTGEYIQFLDADDILLEDKFTSQLHDFQLDNSLDISVCDYEFSYVNLFNRFVLSSHAANFGNDEIVPKLLFNWERGFSIPVHCFLFKKSIFSKQNQSFFFDEALFSREDWLMWCSLALSGAKFTFNSKVLAIYRMHSNSMTKNILRSIKGFIIAQTKIANLIQDINMRNEFIEASAEHICNYYLYEYKNSVIPKEIYFVCLGKFKRMCTKIIKRIKK